MIRSGSDSALLEWLLLFTLSAPSWAYRQGYTLTITAEGASSSEGVVGVLVFNSPQGWPTDNTRAFRAVAVPAHPGSFEIQVSNLPPGACAAVVLHDLNENRKLDRTWFGKPTEQWGMSDNQPVNFSASGFSQAGFTLDRDEAISVVLH
ncbi:MAG TPA: DUF2141 domain-containing protein [Terriglobia bacterium]|nr:DUF2141 domain-containing protein [Terriglobia bacterium]